MSSVFKSWTKNIKLNIYTLLLTVKPGILLVFNLLLVKFFLCCSLHSLVENGVSGISKLFQSLENLLIGQEPALHKKSLFGRFSIQIFRIACLYQ